MPETRHVGKERSPALAALKRTADPAHQKAKNTPAKSNANTIVRRSAWRSHNSPDSVASDDSSSCLYLRQSPRHILPRVLIILQFTCEITLVRTEVEVAVSA